MTRTLHFQKIDASSVAAEYAFFLRGALGLEDCPAIMDLRYWEIFEAFDTAALNPQRWSISWQRLPDMDFCRFAAWQIPQPGHGPMVLPTAVWSVVRLFLMSDSLN